jgi:hypothetical protein
MSIDDIEITLTPDADIDQDGDVDGRNLTRILAVYGLDENDTNFDPMCEFVSDGIVDEKDVEAWALYFKNLLSLPDVRSK